MSFLSPHNMLENVEICWTHFVKSAIRGRRDSDFHPFTSDAGGGRITGRLESGGFDAGIAFRMLKLEWRGCHG